MFKRSVLRSLVGATALFFSVAITATDLYVEVGQTRSPEGLEFAIEQQVFRLSRNVAVSSLRVRDAFGTSDVKPFFPTRVILTSNGVPLPMDRSAGSTDLIPTFDTEGDRVFPGAYQTLLEYVFTEAKSTMNAVFGSPKVGGVVKIKNYDADIQDRYAVAGGIYIPNAPGGPEIRIPVYLSNESAAVNYVHTLLLAYAGDAAFPWDVYSEGLVRAATMRVVRTPSALPATLDSEQLEATLEATYDQSTFYSWYNQPALGGPAFIAPNLIDELLPVGGSTGGIYLLRYQMAGTAWLKVLTEYPAFASEFNSRFYLNPAAYQTEGTLQQLAQETLDFLKASSGATVEGYEFVEWALRQHIFDVSLSPGTKVLTQALPITPTPGTSDFGVYGIILNAFKTAPNGDETFLTGTSYPIYFRPDFSRFFVTAQDDVIPVVGAYGSVVPNFPGDTFSGDMYRVAIDVPFAGHVERVNVPAGGFATGSDPFPNNFYGTVSGMADPSPNTYVVEIEFGGTSPVQVPVINQAFGADIEDTAFDTARPTTITLLLDDGQNQTTVFQRKVNKGFGALAIDLFPPDLESSYMVNKVAGLDMVGLPLRPFRPSVAELLDITPDQTLLARWNPISASYDLYPDIGHFLQGFGYYTRPPAAGSVEVKGRSPGLDPVSVMLQPGWNMVTVPFNQSFELDDLLVTVATEAFATYDLAKGDSVGLSVFGWIPDAGNPDLGLVSSVTTLEPGKAYFIRALRPEGAVLLFTPSPPPSLKTSLFEGPLTSLSPDANFASGFGGSSNNDYKAKITVWDSKGNAGTVFIGQKSRGYRGVDFSEDVDLPPAMDGFKVGVKNELPLYQDIRKSGTAETFEIMISGLEVGKQYRLSLRQSSGFTRYQITQLSTGKRYRSYGFSNYYFTAQSQSERILVTAGGY